MASPEEELKTAFKISIHLQQQLSSSQVPEDSCCQHGSTSPQQQACPHHISFYALENDFHCWRCIGDAYSLGSDLEIALFLISFYKNYRRAANSTPVCKVCQEPLPLTCSTCHDSPPSLPSDITSASPVQDSDSRWFSPLQHKDREYTSSDIDRGGLQTLGQSAEDNSSSQSASKMVTDQGELPLDHLSEIPGGPLCSDSSDKVVSEKCTKTHLRTAAAQRHMNKKRFFVGKTKQQWNSLKTRHKYDFLKEKQKMFKCQSCEAMFKKHYSLRQHIANSHTHSSPFVCQLCGKSCSSSVDLDAHTRTCHTLFDCPACAATFTNDVKYKAHVLKQHPGLKPYRCQCCDKAYTSKQSLLFHCQKMHADSQPQTDGIISSNRHGRFQCQSCNAVFHRQNLLKLHVISHKPQVPFLCYVCGLPCSDERDLFQHRLTHTPFQCPICDIQFAHSTKYVAHIRRQHPGVKAYKCPHCNKAFDTRKWLTVHVLKHTGERPHLCPECGKSFTEAQVLQRHRLAIHQGTRAYSCSKCNKMFKTSSALAYHRRSHGDVKTCLCDGCGRTFLCPSTLLAHSKTCKVHNHGDRQDNSQAINGVGNVNVDSNNKTESDQMKFVCSDCGTAFKGQQWLYRHQVNKPAACSKKFACKFCPRVFRDNRNFVRHVRVHTGEKPFTCETCEVKFTTSSDLHRHARTHSGIKPYTCHHCQQRFQFRCDLTTHLRTHSGETPYPCGHCDSTFISASQRLRHMRTKHKSVVCVERTPKGKKMEKDYDKESIVSLATGLENGARQSAV